MHADTQTLSDKLTTTTARLRGVSGVHERDMTTSDGVATKPAPQTVSDPIGSIYRFVGQQRSEQSQASIVSRQREVRIA